MAVVEVAGIIEREHYKRGEMNCEPDHAEGKKPYEPPRLTTISLRPEEAVLGHCKIAGGGGGFTGICSAIPACVNLGS